MIELEGTPGASPAIDRKKGFDEVLAASSIKLLASQAADFYRAKGQSVMENLLQAHHDFQAVYAANDEMILGPWRPWRPTACRPAGVVTVGFDVIPDAAKCIKEGRLTASIEQFPGQQGRQACGSWWITSARAKCRRRRRSSSRRSPSTRKSRSGGSQGVTR